MKVTIFNVINSPFAAYKPEGDRVYDKLAPLIRSGKKVDLSFFGVKKVSTMFLNSCVGKLYLNFDSKKVDRLLKVVDSDSIPLLKQKLSEVKKNAENPVFHDKIADSAAYH